MQALPGGP